MHVGLIHLVTIYRDHPTGGDDSWGVPAETIEAVSTNVPALVQQTASREQPLPSGVDIIDAVAFLPYGSDARAGDLIQHGLDAYRVVAPPVNAGGAGHHLEVPLRRVVL